MIRSFVAVACLLAALAAIATLPGASASSTLVPRVTTDVEHGSACVIYAPAADAGTATCVQSQDPDCLVETTYETIAGPYTVCTVPRP